MDSEKQKKRILIVGGDSLIGSAVANFLDSSAIVYRTTRRKTTGILDRHLFVDLTDVSSFRIFDDTKFDVVFWCAAETSMAMCDTDPSFTRMINIESLRVCLSRYFEQTHFIYLSSDQIFDGTFVYPAKDSIQNPKSEYGRQKREAEETCSMLHPNLTIVRLTNILGPSNEFFRSTVEKLKSKENVAAYADYFFSGVDLESCVHALAELVSDEGLGVHHLSGFADISYLQACNYLQNKIHAGTEDLVKAELAPPDIYNAKKDFISLGDNLISEPFSPFQPLNQYLRYG